MHRDKTPRDARAPRASRATYREVVDWVGELDACVASSAGSALRFLRRRRSIGRSIGRRCGLAVAARPLIKHRLFAAYDHAHDARLDDALYGQRWLAETAFSAIKRRSASALTARRWYAQFRELVLTATAYNLEQTIPT